jgi:hypothetical protein
VVARVAAHGFPKLANQYQFCCRDARTEQLLGELVYWDLAIIDSPVLVTMSEYLGGAGVIRSHSPSTVILAYFSGSDINPQYQAPIIGEFSGTVDSSWYLRDIYGARVPLFEVEPDLWTWTLNPTTPVNGHLPAFVNDRILATRLVDGIFYDWASTSIAWLNHRHPSQNAPIDMTGDGLADPDSAIDSLWRKGFGELLANSRRQFPPATVVIGNAGWGTAWDYDSLLQGVMIEQFLEGETVSQERFGWEAIMRTYAHFQQNAVAPRLSIIMANRDDPDDTQFMRFALASTLMFDGYFCFTNRTTPTPAYQTAWWYDEYAVDRTSGTATKDLAWKGYLGRPIAEAVSADDRTVRLADALAMGDGGAVRSVWRRDFEHGIVVVNPTKGDQTVDLGGAFRKILGVRDSVFNNGSMIDTIVLPQRSGAVLLRL